jgi:hypothetical protein
MDCTSRILGTAVAIAAVVSMTLPAAGFFDFFGTQQPQPQPYYYGQSPRYGGWGSYRHSGPHRPHHAKAPADEKIARQTPTDLMHDATLRYGDAVMTKSGIRIFTGTRKASHDRDDFSPLQDVRVKPSQKIALDAVDPAHPNGTRGSKSSVELRSGRSSASTIPFAKGVMIDSGNGKAIRYVGP